jgi:LssY C-terminus
MIAMQKLMTEFDRGAPEIRRVLYRIGVHLGDALLDGDDILGARLRIAVVDVGWSEADQLGLASSWGMTRSFVPSTSYPTAPFGSLYLTGEEIAGAEGSCRRLC